MKKIKVDFNIDGELLSFISFKFEIFSQLRLQGGLGTGLIVSAWVVTLWMFYASYWLIVMQIVPKNLTALLEVHPRCEAYC